MNKMIKSSIDAQFIRYPAEKDATDTELVLDYILENYPSQIIIIGATGGED